MEAYLEDNRPTLDEICEEYDECTEDCPAWKFCKAESKTQESDIEKCKPCINYEDGNDD